MSVNEDIADAFTSHRGWLLRYELSTVRDLQREYDTHVGPLWDRIEELRKAAVKATLTDAERAELGELGLALDDAIQAFRQTAAPFLDEAVRAAADVSRVASAEDVAKNLPPELSAGFRKVAQVDQIIAALGDVGGPRWSTVLESSLFEHRNRVQAVLLQAASTGASMPKIARSLKQLTKIKETYKGRFTNIARTEMQRVSNEAARQTFAANQDVIKAIQYLATLDSRTCPICGPTHNRVYTYDQQGVPRDADGNAAPDLPRHPRCRCFYSPVTRSWEELGLGRSPGLTGKPAPETSYPQWFRRQSTATQEDILGPGRYNLWKSGAVALEELSVGDRLLTLADLRARIAA